MTGQAGFSGLLFPWFTFQVCRAIAFKRRREESEPTQSACDANLPIYLWAISMIFLNIIPFTPRFYVSKWIKLLDYCNYYVSLLHSLFYSSCMLGFLFYSP